MGRAATAAEVLGTRVEGLAEDLRSERWWRRFTAYVSVALALVFAVGMVYVVISISQGHTILRRTNDIVMAIQSATGPKAQAQQSTAVQNAIAQVVGETDCRVRDDVADVLHAAIPSVAIVLPATTTCPAYTPR